MPPTRLYPDGFRFVSATLRAPAPRPGPCCALVSHTAILHGAGVLEQVQQAGHLQPKTAQIQGQGGSMACRPLSAVQPIPSAGTGTVQSKGPAYAAQQGAGTVTACHASQPLTQVHFVAVSGCGLLDAGGHIGVGALQEAPRLGAVLLGLVGHHLQRGKCAGRAGWAAILSWPSQASGQDAEKSRHVFNTC
jgi:hypothetical protein